MKKPLFTGVCTALVTPFQNGQINYPMISELLQRQWDAGIRSVVIAGTTGEAATLTDDEKLELFRQCKRIAGENLQIIAGTGSNSTQHALRLSMEAEQTGVDGLLVVSPYYNKATADGIVEHYGTIAAHVSLPLIVYNVPSRTGLDIPVSVYRKLSEIPNIAGAKEASADIVKFLRIREACGEALPLWSGNDDMTAAVIALGGKGVISVASNIVPTQMRKLAEAALSHNTATAADMQCKLLPLTGALFCDVNPVPVKEALRILGYDCGSCRLPLTGMTPSGIAQMKKVLELI